MSQQQLCDVSFSLMYTLVCIAHFICFKLLLEKQALTIVGSLIDKICLLMDYLNLRIATSLNHQSYFTGYKRYRVIWMIFWVYTCTCISMVLRKGLFINL
jgi:hypothetical protein